jgi:hypothetical protein
VAGNDSRIGIEAASGCKPDNQPNHFVFVKRLLCQCLTGAERKDDSKDHRNVRKSFSIHLASS